jgi:aryl-alcohol dehydrogenase-like predicted oxidoreductase
VEILTKVCLPSGPGPNDRGLSRKHIMESCHTSLRNLGTDYMCATDARGSRFVGRYLGDPVLSAVQRLRPVADELGLTLAQLAVAWVLQNPGVASAIVGASRPEQLRENTAAAGRKLDPDVMARIDAAFVDDVHGDLVERDPAKIATPFDVMPAWKS